MDKKLVVLGGGTGTSSVLRGLKFYTDEISAIVTMSDDGGGSGILRKELNILPPGDVRSCLAALSNTDAALKNLLGYRFKSGSMKGQNLGNIIIAAMTDIYGSFNEGLIEMSSIFNITGKVFPVTLDETHLVAEFESKDKVVGESYIPKMAYRLNTKIKKMSMIPHFPKANPFAIRAIKDADIVVLGPGSLYTSIIPNLLVSGINDAIKETNAKVIYIANAMTECGETIGYSIRDHYAAIEEHSFEGVIDEIYVNKFKVGDEIYRHYFNVDESEPIFLTEEDKKYFKEKGIKVVEDNFIEVRDEKIRHSGKKIGDILFSWCISCKRSN